MTRPNPITTAASTLAFGLYLLAIVIYGVFGAKEEEEKRK